MIQVECVVGVPVKIKEKLTLNLTLPRLKILLLSSAYNGMTQRVECELLKLQQQVSFALASSATAMGEAVAYYQPDLIICPTLMIAIPAEIYQKYTCLIVHPGIKGDRGPSALDWAILHDQAVWGVTLIEASATMDAGAIWGSNEFLLPKNISKTQLYNNLVIPHAVQLISAALVNWRDPQFVAEQLNYADIQVKGREHPVIRQSDLVRMVDFTTDTTAIILAKMHAADSAPGLKAQLLVANQAIICFLYGGVIETSLNADLSLIPGSVIAKLDEAVCIASKDGAFWVRQLRYPKTSNYVINFKLPASVLLGELLSHVAIIQREKLLLAYNPHRFQEISYQKYTNFAVLEFDFYNGAMSKEQCHRLSIALKACAKENIQGLILAGSVKNWSNGINLNVIQAAENPAKEAWDNIKAINQVVKDVLALTNIVTISTLRANAGAGGVYLAVASDFVFAKDEIVINPHYKNMGLYGSELHTFTAARRIGVDKLAELKDDAQPLLGSSAMELGLFDNLANEGLAINCVGLKNNADNFLDEVKTFMTAFLADKQRVQNFLDQKQKLNNLKQINQCAQEELAEMRQDMFDNRNQFNERRAAFVYKNPFSQCGK